MPMRLAPALLLLVPLCAPAQLPTVVSVTAMGRVTQDPLVLVRDGTFSARIGNLSYWSFNDTGLSRSNASGTNFFSNSLSWTANLNASNGIALEGNLLDASGAPATYMPFTPDEAAFNATHDPRRCTTAADPKCGEDYAIWPGPIAVNPDGRTALQYYSLVQRGGAISGFIVVGTGVASINLATGMVTRPIASPWREHPSLLWSGNQTGYGGSALVEGDSIYLSGCTADFLAMNCRVAKTTFDSATRAIGYAYYAGGEHWSDDQRAAQILFQGGPAGNSMFYNTALHQYMLIYSGLFTNEVYIRVAPHPWGPWSAQELLFTATQGDASDLTYAGMAHPEFQQQNSLVQYITYVQTTGILRENVQLVRVEFAAR